MPAVTPVLWKYRTNKDGLSPVYLRLADGDKTRYRSLKLYVREGHWNERAGRVSGRHPNAAEINKTISTELKRAEDEVYRRAAEGERVDAGSVASALRVREVVDKPGQADFFSFADEFVAGYRARGQMWTHDRYVSVLRKVRAYTGEPFPFSGLTPAFLRRYEAHLVSHYGNTVNTVATTLKTVVRRAVAEGLVDHGQNPFALHVIRTEPTAPVRLSLDEVKRVAELDLAPGAPLGLARDTFLIQFFGGGARFSDVAWLRWSSVGPGAIGYTASKTKKVVEVPLVPQAAEVIGRYRPDGGVDPTASVLPHLTGGTSRPPRLGRRRSGRARP